MAGIYIHVPFCRQACRYCDFYFTVSLKYVDDYVDALLKEIVLKKNYLEQEEIETIYFGGGTPSVLSKKHLERILKLLHREFMLSINAEVTLEANPDDLSKSYLKGIREIGFNRLSVGVQSFHQDELSLMRRSHTEKQATESILNASKAGFDNINMDLIYGVPGLSMKKWDKNLQAAMGLPVQHLSAYHLSYEKGTIFDHWRKNGKLFEVDETISIEQYKMLREITGKNGYEHYEISNFAKEGHKSRHNTSYWENKPYLGLGPAAHSYNGEERSWNVSSVKKYIEKINTGGSFNEGENLTKMNRFNDYLIISLRTMRGADLEYIKTAFGKSLYEKLMLSANQHIESGLLQCKQEKLTIHPDNWLKADMIIRDLIE